MKRLNPWHQLAEQVGQFVEQMEKASESTSPTSTSEVPVEEMKATVISELPSSMGIFAFVVVWLNSLMLLGANPGRLREKLGIDAAYFAVWKAPEWLVWPTIGFAALMILASGRWETAGINGFKLLMAVYALQGLSVLSYLLALWRVKRFLRSIVYLMALFPMLPLLLAIGFFDLWFDFRSKIRQS